jgi:hypothetical protein
MSVTARVIASIVISSYAIIDGWIVVATYRRTHEIEWGYVFCIGLLLMALLAVITQRAEAEEEKEVYEARIESPPPTGLWERIKAFATSRAATRALAYLILILFAGYMIYTGYMHRHYSFIPSRDPARYMNAALTFCIAALFILYFLPARRR